MNEQFAAFRSDLRSPATSAFITPGKRSPASLEGQGAFQRIGKLKVLESDPAPLPSPAQKPTVVLSMDDRSRNGGASGEPTPEAKVKAEEEAGDTQNSDSREHKYSSTMEISIG